MPYLILVTRQGAAIHSIDVLLEPCCSTRCCNESVTRFLSAKCILLYSIKTQTVNYGTNVDIVSLAYAFISTAIVMPTAMHRSTTQIPHVHLWEVLVSLTHSPLAVSLPLLSPYFAVYPVAEHTEYHHSLQHQVPSSKSASNPSPA